MRRRVWTSALVVLALVVLLPAPAVGQATADATVQDFAWLAGTWRGQLASGPVAEITYSQPADGLMTAMFQLMEGEKVVLLEYMTLRETPEGIVLRVRHFDPALTPLEKSEAILLKLAEHKGERWVFENPVNAMPKRSIIERTGENSHTARSEIINDHGEVRTIEVSWGRVAPRERRLEKEVTVPAPLTEVWEAWTTTEGVTSFFGPQAHVDATLGGPYEIYFAPDQPYGLRGSEDCKVHSVVPMKLLAFEWNAPPTIPAIRNAGLHTLVTVELEPLTPDTTRVRVTQSGWGVGEDWDKTYAYFDRAWESVLSNLAYRFRVGPVAWPGHFIRAEEPAPPTAKEKEKR